MELGQSTIAVIGSKRTIIRIDHRTTDDKIKRLIIEFTTDFGPLVSLISYTDDLVLSVGVDFDGLHAVECAVKSLLYDYSMKVLNGENINISDQDIRSFIIGNRCMLSDQNKL